MILKIFFVFIFSDAMLKLVSKGEQHLSKLPKWLLTLEQDQWKLCQTWHVCLTYSLKVSRNSCPAAFLGLLFLYFAILVTVNASLELSCCSISPPVVTLLWSYSHKWFVLLCCKIPWTLKYCHISLSLLLHRLNNLKSLPSLNLHLP